MPNWRIRRLEMDLLIKMCKAGVSRVFHIMIRAVVFWFSACFEINNDACRSIHIAAGIFEFQLTRKCINIPWFHYLSQKGFDLRRAGNKRSQTTGLLRLDSLLKVRLQDFSKQSKGTSLIFEELRRSYIIFSNSFQIRFNSCPSVYSLNEY